VHKKGPRALLLKRFLNAIRYYAWLFSAPSLPGGYTVANHLKVFFKGIVTGDDLALTFHEKRTRYGP
jgi:hypothetical protein